MAGVSLVDDRTALLSMRNSDFDTCSAVGEVIDNSLQAGATTIRLLVNFTPTRQEPITSIAFGDDGCGMPSDILHRCLQLGYSTRYNDRRGIGRFGVGATLAAINQCRRVEVHSRETGGAWLYTYIDLDDIAADPPRMDEIPAPTERAVPEGLRVLVGPARGTLVVWSNYDRQPAPASRLIEELNEWVGRTYRKFIWGGVLISINGDPVQAIDPLGVTTAGTRFPRDPKAHEYQEMLLPWPVAPEDVPADGPTESIIRIRMSLLPEELRPTEDSGTAPQARERFLDLNEGVSILRNGREVFYGTIPWWPGAPFRAIDRWWGCEISFDAELDSQFNVKNIKRGAVPVRELKQAIKEKIEPIRHGALARIRQHWREVEARAQLSRPSTVDAMTRVSWVADPVPTSAPFATAPAGIDAVAPIPVAPTSVASTPVASTPVAAIPVASAALTSTPGALVPVAAMPVASTAIAPSRVVVARVSTRRLIPRTVVFGSIILAAIGLDVSAGGEWGPGREWGRGKGEELRGGVSLPAQTGQPSVSSPRPPAPAAVPLSLTKPAQSEQFLANREAVGTPVKESLELTAFLPVPPHPLPQAAVPVRVAAAVQTRFVLGSGQRGRVGEPAALPVVFEVRDSSGAALAGVAVSLSIANGRLVGAPTETDSLGQVRAQVVFGPRAGVPTVVTGTVGALVREATLYPAAGLPAKLEVELDGIMVDGQLVVPSGRPAELRIASRDAYDNPVPLVGLRATVGDDRVVQVIGVAVDSLRGMVTVRAGRGRRGGATNLVIHGSGLRVDLSAVVAPAAASP